MAKVTLTVEIGSDKPFTSEEADRIVGALVHGVRTADVRDGNHFDIVNHSFENSSD